MEFYKGVASPVLDRLDSEVMHTAVRDGLHIAEQNPALLYLAQVMLAHNRQRVWNQRLEVTLGNAVFDNPFIVGAGWDKKGVAARALHAFGAGGVAVGAVLRYPQPGNDKPRQWMIANGVSINALGFNTPGVEKVSKNLSSYENDLIPIIGNIGLNKDAPHSRAAEDYAYVARQLYPYVVGMEICVSSPNTQNLRDLQRSTYLRDIVVACAETVDELGGNRFILLKVDPDMTNDGVDHVIQVTVDTDIEGIVATNTTNNPDIKAKYPKGVGKPGGLAGDDRDFRRMATSRVAYVRRALGPAKIVIGVGGVKDAPTALEKILAGANAFESVTGLRGEGFSIFGKTNEGLINWMDRNGVSNISEIVGLDAHKY